MASCSLGVSNIKTLKLNFQKPRVDNLQKPNYSRTLISQRPPRYAGLIISQQLEKLTPFSCSSSLEVQIATDLVDDSEETISPGLTSPLIPNLSEVKFLVKEVCKTTSVAEFELKLGGFQLYLMRDLAGKTESPPVSTSPSTTGENTTVETTVSNGSVSAPSLAITKAPSSSGVVQVSLLDKAADEGLVILKSPKVGTFRRCLTRKGTRFPPACQEKKIVKEGQVLCFIEQFAAQIPVRSDIAGEVIKILREDGDPVGYGDPLLAILPSFPGIKYLH
ncbi:hypothetical protein SLEP1_g44028 [Rubroshorea leprosula]|uniref:Lipoyl-binding domain-containing protein n=1 Tax=Rubroshorea leprosula TaxID=152421 RepID=A0AAV5LG25_9ROSI|nr:hypothetical protein SLEP1_g44028 [Rubroshorea leprosula]